LPDHPLVEDAEQVDIHAWLQADLASPDTYYTDAGASEPDSAEPPNKVYLPLVNR
jgi:hypothetical protein